MAKTTTPSNLPQVRPQQLDGPEPEAPKVPSFEEQQQAGTVGVKSATPPAPKAPAAPRPAPPQTQAEVAKAPEQPKRDTFTMTGNKIDVVKNGKTVSIDEGALEMYQKAGYSIPGMVEEEPLAQEAPTVAESTSKVNADGSTTTETKDFATPEAQEYKKQLDDAMQSVDAEVQYAKSKFSAIAASADEAQKNLMIAIEKTFEVRKAEMERINKAALNTQKLLGARGGRQRYAPEMQASILSEEERAGLVRFTEIEALEYQTIALAQQAATDEDLAILSQQMNTMRALRAEKNDIISNMYSLAVDEEQRAQTRASFEVNLQTKVQELSQSQQTFDLEIQEYQSSYLAQNLVQINEDGSVDAATDEEIANFAADFGVDPLVLNAKVNQTARDLASYDIGMRAQVLQNRQLELANRVNTFSLEKSKALLPYEIDMAALNVEKARVDIDQARANVDLTNSKIDETLAQLKSQSVNIGQLSQEELDKLDKTEEKKRLDTLRKLKVSLKNYEGLIQEYGKASFLQPQQRDELQAARTDAIGTWKDYQALGALTGPDLELAETAIPDVTENWFQAISPFGATKENRALKVLENSFDTIDEEATASWEQLTRRNSQYEKTDYVRGLYKPFADEGFYVDYNDWAQNAPPDEARDFTNALINAGVDETDEEAVMQLWKSQYLGVQPDFKNDLSTSVKGIKDYSKVETSVGRGVATGIERGSSLWQYGFDLVLEGGKGAPVKSPVSGTVLSATNEGGFGKRVRVKLDDGRVIAAAHLDQFSVKPGAKIRQGEVLGTQGNTGSTLGRTGIHVDWTLYDKDGKPQSSQQAAQFLNTKAIG